MRVSQSELGEVVLALLCCFLVLDWRPSTSAPQKTHANENSISATGDGDGLASCAAALDCAALGWGWSKGAARGRGAWT